MSDNSSISLVKIGDHQQIPAHWRVQRSTPFFTRETVPAALLSHHNTAAGVFGQLCVMSGIVTYYGYANIGTVLSFRKMPDLISISGQIKRKKRRHCSTQKRVKPLSS